MKECIHASRQLKRKYVGRTTSSNRPAGCYWSGGERSYFNTITELSDTWPKNFGSRGGICTKQSTSKYQCCLSLLPHKIIFEPLPLDINDFVLEIETTVKVTTKTTTLWTNTSLKTSTVSISYAQTNLMNTTETVVITGSGVSQGMCSML